MGIIPGPALNDIYLGDDFGFRDDIELAFGITYPGQPTPSLPFRDSPLNYPSMYGKAQLWIAGNDELYVSRHLGFWAYLRAEVHNVGATGHIGPPPGSNPACEIGAPALHIPDAEVVRFIDDIHAAL